MARRFEQLNSGIPQFDHVSVCGHDVLLGLGGIVAGGTGRFGGQRPIFLSHYHLGAVRML